MRDVSNGWAVRYAHANGASFFLIFVYAQTQFYLLNFKNIYPLAPLKKNKAKQLINFSLDLLC